jgi:sarcosine oxidase
MPAQPHVIVLGLGIAGSSIAATLAERGFRVTGIEQFSALHERGSSHGDTRIFRRVPHEGDVYVHMAAASLEGWRAWSRLAEDRLFVECGGIDAGPEDSGMVAAAEQLCRRYDQPFEVLDGKGFNRRYPQFQLPADWRVVYQPSSGVVRPDATRVFLHKHANASGARLMHDVRVLGIEATPRGVMVQTAGDAIYGDFLVCSAGSWLPKLFPEVPFSFSSERRVLAWFEPDAASLTGNANMPIFVLDAAGGWYGMPTPDGRVKIGHDKHLRQQVDPDAMPIQSNAEDARLLSRCVRDFLVGFREEPNEMKSCIYSLTEDHHFLIDRHPEHSNVLLFSCCSGHGFKYAPVYGEIAAGLIGGAARMERRMNLELFRLKRGDVTVTRFGD